MDQERLVEATRAAAEYLAARGAAAHAEGATLSSVYAGGLRVVVRNRLQRSESYCGERLVSQVSGEIVRALLTSQIAATPHSPKSPGQ